MGIEQNSDEQTEFKSHYMRSIPEGEPFSEVDEINLKIDRMIYRHEQETFHPLTKLRIKVWDKIDDIIDGSKNLLKNLK